MPTEPPTRKKSRFESIPSNVERSTTSSSKSSPPMTDASCCSTQLVANSESIEAPGQMQVEQNDFGWAGDGSVDTLGPRRHGLDPVPARRQECLDHVPDRIRVLHD